MLIPIVFQWKSRFEVQRIQAWKDSKTLASARQRIIMHRDSLIMLSPIALTTVMMLATSNHATTAMTSI